jgi:glyoxylase-like metal-dependent hydrolase (beta-lactamase superfamily II)/8-oxo-dGTP pyrophosphatase MutT (NUDIX family)
VFWLRRGEQLSFAGGFHAFPGGRLDEADAQVPVEGASGEDAAFIACAAREVLEETGILLAKGRVGVDEVRALRLLLLESDGKGRSHRSDASGDFGAFLRKHGLTLHAEDFGRAGRYVTPAAVPKRFDCRFFLVEVPPGTASEVIPGELAEGAFITPAEALARWEQGLALLHPPGLDALKALAVFESREKTLEVLQHPPHMERFIPSRVEFQKGFHFFPLRSPTLPPATHTNAYVLGNGELIVVDPGSDEDAETAKLERLLVELKAEGKKPLAIVLTHHHQDHVSGAGYLQERLELPIWCHARTADRLPWKTERLLSDGEVLTLAGEPPMRFRVLHTPGHARGHLTLVDEASRAAVVGDMVAGMGTILIDPPEGDMAEYLKQLARLRDLPVRGLYPAHGPPVPNGPAKLSEYLAHRQAREEKVLGLLGSTPRTLAELAREAYSDAPLVPSIVTELSTLAVLRKLIGDGKAEELEPGFRLIPLAR